MKLNKKISSFCLATAAIFTGTTAKAVCPVCTIALGACVGLARWLKIDDRITGLWIGGLIVSLIVWTIRWLDKKNIRFKGKKILVIVIWYAAAILPLYFTGMIGSPLNKCWGMDKLLFGIAVGSVVFAASAFLHDYLKKKNNHKSYFPLQKVAFPVGFLAIASLMIYLIIR